MRFTDGITITIAAAALVTSPTVFAYGLNEHSLMTNIATAELGECFPGLLPAEAAEKIRSGAVLEDVNLLRKWFHYSHFYNPTKDLAQWRKPSIARVKDLDAELAAQTQMATVKHDEIYHEIGYLVHHFQDMTAPAHVVPVMHGPGDAYEDFKIELQNIPAPDLTTRGCNDLTATADTPSLLKAVALETLTQTEKTFSAMFSLEKPRPATYAVALTWTMFWQASPETSNEFGHYGELGDNFGKTHLKWSDGTLSIPSATYTEFKGRQMRRAIEASKTTILRYFLQFRDKPETNETPPNVALRTRAEFARALQ